MKMDEILAWFKVMGIMPTTAEYLRTKELFEKNNLVGATATMLPLAPLMRVNQFRQLAKKFFKEIKWWHFLRFVPGVRAVALNNKSAFLAHDGSRDFDLFIVAAKNTVWWVRFFVTILALIFNKRRTDKNFAGKWCLSFFLAEGLNFRDFKILPNEPETFWREDNLLWLVGQDKGHPALCRRAFRWRIFSMMAKPFDSLAYITQKKYFLRQNKNLGEGVVLTSQVAKFHTVDHRREHFETWQKLIA